MSLRLSSLLCHCAGVAAFGLASINAAAQVPSIVEYGQPTPGATAPATASDGSIRGSLGYGSSSTQLSPGFQEVVCPGGLYGGAFHPFNRRAFAGAGYYGFFHRYWSYDSHGPSYNMTPGSRPSCSGTEQLYTATRACLGNSKQGCIIPYREQSAVTNNSPAEPRPVNVAHLQLLVPENAEVLVEGVKTSTEGAIREFVTPPLPPGENLLYTIVVRTPTAGGKTTEESQTVRVRANDRFRVDFTAPVKPLRPIE